MTRKMMPEKYRGKIAKNTVNTSRNVKTVFFFGGGVGIKMNRIFNADTNCNKYLHIHIQIYVYKMAPGSNQQPWFAILNSNFEMYSVRVRNVEVYKAQRQLRPIQLKNSLVAIQDFTQDLIFELYEAKIASSID